MVENSYPLEAVPHRFLSIQGGFDTSLDAGEAIIKGWLAPVNAMERTEESLSNLKIALQCGGSDAFSGVSGNPLAAYVAKEVIRYGGAANLAETDELIGAEPYVLQNARDFGDCSHVFKIQSSGLRSGRDGTVIPLKPIPPAEIIFEGCTILSSNQLVPR